MGGYVGITTALRAPERVRSIVSHAMKFFWTDAAIAVRFGDLDSDLLRERSQRGYDALAQMHAAGGLEGTLAQTRSLISDFSRWQLTPEMVGQAPAPLLLSVGDRDELVPVAEVARLFNALDTKRSGLGLCCRTLRIHSIMSRSIASSTTCEGSGRRRYGRAGAEEPSSRHIPPQLLQPDIRFRVTGRAPVAARR